MSEFDQPIGYYRMGAVFGVDCLINLEFKR
jgi:hypothetical protein